MNGLRLLSTEYVGGPVPDIPLDDRNEYVLGRHPMRIDVATGDVITLGDPNRGTRCEFIEVPNGVLELQCGT
jgi:hypothetical protein